MVASSLLIRNKCKVFIANSIDPLVNSSVFICFGMVWFVCLFVSFGLLQCKYIFIFFSFKINQNILSVTLLVKYLIHRKIDILNDGFQDLHLPTIPEVSRSMFSTRD